MCSVKSVTELPLSRQTRTCIGDQHVHLQYSTEYEALISLANDKFGLYTWSHTVTHQNIDFIDCDSNKYSAGVVAFVKVELKNGIYHQDVGYGTSNNSCCKGYAIACARKEAAENGLQEALRSFGCHFTRKVNEPADTPVESFGFKMSLQMDKHRLDTAVTNSSRLSTDASPTVCLPSSDDLKLDRKRRQQQEQEQFVMQLKEKQLTNGKDLQSKSLVDKNIGVHNEYFVVRCRWEYKTPMDRNEIKRVVWNGFIWLRIGTNDEAANEPLGCVKRKGIS